MSITDGKAASRRTQLKLSPQLRRVGLIHAWLVCLTTPVAAIAALISVKTFGFSLADAAFLVGFHILGFCGVAIALHRYFSHRAFRAVSGLRAVLAVLAMTAGQGSLVFWVANHRYHHRYSDSPEDPHSPHHPPRLWKDIWRAHMGWMFAHRYANPALFATDLLSDRGIMRLNALYPIWVVVGLLVPAAMGLVAFGSIEGAARGFVWGGLVRLATVHNATFAVNSFAHRFGRQRFETRDESRNLLLLALPTLGDSFHNNHHAFPTSARAGVVWWEFDLAFLIIRVLAKFGLVSDLVVKRAPASRLGTEAANCDR